jgi:radical SAM protein with 4Fe4S-binding SPASM domain
VSCVLTNKTVHEKQTLEDLVKPYVDAIKWTDVRIQGGNMLKTIGELSVEEHDERNRLKPCGLLWNGLHVDYEGDMTLCCVDFDGEMLVGNIKQRGLLDCWNGPEMRECRRLHLSSSLDVNSLCYRCLTGSKLCYP